MADFALRADSVRANPTLQIEHRSVVLRRIREACDRHGIAPTRFGRNACNDPGLVQDMRNGRDPGHEVRARIGAYLASLDAEA